MDTKPSVTVAAAMTAPRYESVWARTKIDRAMHRIGIPLNVSGGVYYGQCMQIMLEDFVEKGIDYALTVDFDSVFMETDIERLIKWIANDPKIDAVAAIQPKRGDGQILGAIFENNDKVVWDGTPVKVDSAHFGLTVIDLKKLAAMPKPWFHHQPDANGSWSPDKIDDDVWFWKSWQEAGNSVYIDPATRLGHLEEMVSVFDENMKLQHIYPKQWSELYENQVSQGVETA